MNADRETNGDMTHRDIALLLAEAADEVEIGIAPTQAVLRGGRRRRARRWAVAAATALVIAGTSGAVAVAGLPGGTDKASVATKPSPEQRDLTAPYVTTLASGTDKGKPWFVTVDVWPVPRNKAEAETVWDALTASEGTPPDAKVPTDLIGTVTYFVKRTYGVETTKVMENRIPATESMSGTDLQTAAIPLVPDTDGPQRLVIGQVARTAVGVDCQWKDGTNTEVFRARNGELVSTDRQVIRRAQGSPVDWFVCLAPEGTSYKDVLVFTTLLPEDAP
ncbi:hypothetical protein BN159_6090 [Streptomyces davaonensis JCM 4913]|uniref:Uncharacterized protein n=1 Tax=Streptomyces davaonensis (strain DSM 101723 / JCM 4913 / KCC S-0913 / 768) TaxID=1214101 RepID=K4RC97_STRDJ|nr:hypothetical protein [Streptomyces davaonensis]CCK30469.1 hypothetical protein BN159_6090 [Streptomyces davaonensis JCM 4913]